MGLCLFFDIIYIICKAKSKNIIGLFAKTLAAFCFITIGYMGYLVNKTSFSYFILFGLILDGFGDLFLAFRNIFAKNVTFIIGTLCFLAGHILFIRGLFLIQNSYFIHCVICAVLTGPIIFFMMNRICRFSKVLMVIGMAYITLISMMVYMSAGVYFTHETVSSLLFMIGAIMFVSSDIILVIYNFSKKEKWMHPVYSLLYFIGQLLISFSLHI